MSSLKERYNADPEYKQKHLDYVNAKRKCILCNVSTSRSNFRKHEKTRKHIINLNSTISNKLRYEELIKQLQSLNLDNYVIENIKNEINKIKDENETTWKKIRNMEVTNI